MTASPTMDQRREYALAAMRIAVLRARMIASEAEIIGIAVKEGFISPRAAIVWASEVGMFDLVTQEGIETSS
jgi:hypothetical protein